MSDLKNAIRKQRMKQAADENPVNAFLKDVAEMKVEELLADIPSEMRELVLTELAKIVSTVKKGDAGKDGKSIKGPKGEKGDKGDAGKDGKSIKGPKGVDGRKLKTVELLKKINKAKNGIKISSISGLESILDGFRRAMRENVRQKHGGGGGGGMGNPQHEVFDISAGTTAVTTNHPIAAGGNAIFKSAYQGMALDKDIHFTVGANRKTITFDAGVAAQFENNTVFSLTYIRG
jgi:hypothetical protein